MILDSLLAGVMLFGSYAIRTPNEQPNPDDYEVSIGVTHKYFHVNRQWEQELGKSYIDDLFWVKIDNGLYFKPEYMNKESKDIKYIKIDWRRSWKDYTWGCTTRSTTDELDDYETFASIGMKKKKTYWDKVEVEATFDGYFPPNDDGVTKFENLEYEDKFKISWKLTDKVRLYNVGEVSKLQGKQFYKGKIGIEVSL
jgi:hypothetical protein|tara:strand:+ start:491 stop:1081 length:591 start_codon:yes stop_codon:yes gene_type:complete